MSFKSNLGNLINSLKSEPSFRALQEIERNLKQLSTNQDSTTQTINTITGTTITSIVAGLPTYVDGINPTDSGDHKNFNLPSIPNPVASCILVLNGQVLTLGSDYNIFGDVITLINAITSLPFSLLIWYRTTS